MILNTNLGNASWGRIFDDPTVAAAMLDRLLHRSVVFDIQGDSNRMRAHRARADRLRKGVNASADRQDPPVPVQAITWGVSVIRPGESP